MIVESIRKIEEEAGFQELLEIQVFKNFLDIVKYRPDAYFKDLIIEKTMNIESITVHAENIPSAKVILDQGLILIYNVHYSDIGHTRNDNRGISMGNNMDNY